jgi:non-specific protein-tyrosine kinase
MTELITLVDPRSPAAEAYQSLRTNVEFSSLEQPLKTLLVAGVDATTEKSIALANLAVVMAEAGDEVIVVDGDLRRPQQHEIFGVHNQQGVADWLQSGGSLPLQGTAVNRLRVLPAGAQHANPVALLSSKRLNELFAELSQQADYVLCDAPPVLAVTDAALWASAADGVVLLVNAGSTRREQAQQAKDVLEKVRAHIIGAVLLNVEKEMSMLGYTG